MSVARDRVTQVLTEFWPQEQVDHAADALMPVVRDAVARGFETAAGLLTGPTYADAADRLRGWAQDARRHNPVREG